jgi:DNA-binding transcriptional LysR family regulator
MVMPSRQVVSHVAISKSCSKPLTRMSGSDSLASSTNNCGLEVHGSLDGTLDLGFLRDGEPRDGLSIESILRERFIAVLPGRHRLAGRTTIRPGDLRNEPFVLFARRMGPFAFDRTISCCEAEGFRLNVVEEAPQWPTVVRLVAAGSGISLAPASVANFAMPGVVYKNLRSRHWTSIDIGLKAQPRRSRGRSFLEHRAQAILEDEPRFCAAPDRGVRD